MIQHPLLPLISVYVIATISYLMIQMTMAVANWVMQKWQEPHQMALVDNLLAKGRFPRISIIYPIYNEDPDVLQRVMEYAVGCLEIPGLEVIFVDDGSPNLAECEPIYQYFEERDNTGRLRILRESVNRGKREALNRGFEVANGEYIITADSDTLIEAEQVLNLVAPIIADERLGAVTGDVRVENFNDTWLTHLIALRYWVSFHVERGAQSFSGSMMVCSGPFTVYRADLIHRVRHDFVSQTFLGQPCTYGDDRHLTWLILKQGYLTRIQEGAVARTMAPRTIPEYVPQQIRWTKSFIREFLWVIRDYNRVSIFSLLDTLYQPIISFCFMFALSNVVFMTIESFNPLVLIGEIFILLFMASLRGIYGFLRTGWTEFIRFPLYGVLHVSIILPLRWKALFGLRDTSWGTRKTKKKQNEFVNFLYWMTFFFSTICVLGLGVSLIVSIDTTFKIEELGLNNIVQVISNLITSTLYWWERAGIVALILSPIFLALGIRRQGLFTFIDKRLAQLRYSPIHWL